MISEDFLKSCSHDEQSILYIILWQTFQPCGYEPSYSCVKYLRKDILIKILNNLKNQILPENLNVLENLQKKISQEI